MQDASGYGISVWIQAIPTFPTGFKVTEFPEDVDPVAVSTVAITEFAMGVNGDLIIWRTPKPNEITIGVIPNSDTDKNIQILFDADRNAKDKVGVKNVVNMMINYPDGKQKVFGVGAIVEGMPANSVSGSGRIASKTWRFVFERALN